MSGTMPARQLCDAVATAGISGLLVTPERIDRGAREAGAYLLMIRLAAPLSIHLPRLGSPRLEAGWYLYAGSARGPGGLAARVRRHFRQDKVVRWHVDRLTVACAEMAALLVAGGTECDLVRQLLASGRFETATSGFGSTDCSTCEGHLLMQAGTGGSRRQPGGKP